MRPLSRIASTIVVVVALLTTPIAGQQPGRITSPREQFGFDIGTDYQLVNYSQFTEYWRKLARESDRMVLREIGPTAEGRQQLMAIISAPDNLRRLEHYREISRRLALAENLDSANARSLASEGRAIVWIDGGLHADEVVGTQQLISTVYELLRRDDAETLRILNDVIVLAVLANPDGMELVSNWYMRTLDPSKRSTSGVPRLYQKYIGHDNNRDFYLSSQPETRNMNRVMYREWFPQIVYNHHQSGPAGTVMFAPPFRDPFNYNFDPLIPIGIDMVAAAMHTRFLVESKPGVTMRSGSNYSTWWNGGLRTTAYFHNMIGLLTEIIGNPTPMTIPFIARRQLPTGDLPSPIEPQLWHFAQSIDYSLTANRAVLDIASRHREQFLFDIYRMGRNSIERGSRDNWTASPSRIDAAASVIIREMPRLPADGLRLRDDTIPKATPERFRELLRNPAQRDARGYILPSDQPDFHNAIRFVNALLDNGVTVMRATRPFSVGARSYPVGSFVIKTAQAFRPHILDMFEPQDHPNDIPYPGGPPKPPYDNAGYTLAFQMGLRFDRLLDDFSGPFEKISDAQVAIPPGRLAGSGRAGYVISHATNDAFLAISKLLAGGDEVYWLAQPWKHGRKVEPAGAFFVSNRAGTQMRAQQIARSTGVNFEAVGNKPGGQQLKLKQPRVGLWDRYGGSSNSGWIRWILERYEIPYDVLFPVSLDKGVQGFDALIFPREAIPPSDARAAVDPEDQIPTEVPEEFRAMGGRVTIANTVPRLREYLQNGGVVVTIGGSTVLAKHLGLPVEDALIDTAGGKTVKLPSARFYVPGSILRMRVDTTRAIAAGITDPVDVFFDRSPALRITGPGVQRVGWYDSPAPLRSGWAWGQKYLLNSTAVAEADFGKGKLFLFTPEIVFRGQSEGTFKFLFNSIYYGTAELARVR